MSDRADLTNCLCVAACYALVAGSYAYEHRTPSIYGLISEAEALLARAMAIDAAEREDMAVEAP